MKNVVLGIIGCLIVVYTAMLGLSVYNVTVRENQMEKCLSLALSGAMNSITSQICISWIKSLSAAMMWKKLS